MIGKILGNRYKILEQLGGGGMAIIFKGRDNFLNRLVSIKVLRPEFTCDEDFVQRFRREAQAVARLSHPNIVSIYDVGREDETHYLVMEYIEGDNLKNLIRSQGALEPERAAEIALQISEALQHAHENNIVHRDVKPQNILITREGRAKLTDFGIAREATTATLTQTDTIVGSVHYLSPEQARGETAGPCSDIYSLGVVLYEMTTGVLPFQGDTPIAVALKHIQEDPPYPCVLNPAVPLRLQGIITRAMSKDPADRFQSARDMAVNLKAVMNAPGGAAGIHQPDEFATRVIPAVRPAEVPPGSEEPEKEAGVARRIRPMWIWISLALFGLLAGGVFAFQLYMNVPVVKMPTLTEKTRDEARKSLRDLGIKDKNIHESRSNHPTITLGRVISQYPAPDTMVKVTSTVNLVISNGPEERVAPSVIGKQISDARITISQSDLIVVEPPQERPSKDFAPGVVVDQDPKPGQKVAKGSGITLIVSTGPEPEKRQVPDLIGMTLVMARQELNKVNLNLDENVGRSSSRNYLAGQIISQHPPSGQEVQVGTPVRVTVSDGPGPPRRLARVEVRMPDDGREHELRIVVVDIQGTNEVHIDTYNPGQRAIKEVPYYGKARVLVYIDRQLEGEQRFD